MNSEIRKSSSVKNLGGEQRLKRPAYAQFQNDPQPFCLAVGMSEIRVNTNTGWLARPATVMDPWCYA